MTKQFILLSLCTLLLNAEDIVLTAEQEANWQIKVETPQSSKLLPLGEFVTEVVTPPTLIHTISLPFEANVKKLHVANFQHVAKGQILAEVTGTEWIETQQKAISDAIEFMHHEHLAERKNLLCKEEIIPQKECVAANAELEADKIKVSASKTLLKSYGASDEMISNLYKNLKLSQTIQLKSTVEGSIIELNASPGKSTSPAEAFFIIQEKGPLWLESAIEAKRTKDLQKGDKVEITLGTYTFETTILQLSPVINPENQTRQIRFLLPTYKDIFTGLRTSVKITIFHNSLKIRKNAVIKSGDEQIVFVKNKERYTSVPVNILAQDDTYYFIEPSSMLENKIAVSSLAVLKNMLGSEDE
jgi:multidrug efflux pump subunit AcrA (membrane-fusion protein)